MMMTPILIQLILVAAVYFPVTGRDITICPGNTEKVKCDNGEVISVRKAFYGRDTYFRCMLSGRLNRRCGSKNNALAEVSKRCNNQKSCSLHADNSVFQSDCRKKTAYLEIDYRCNKEVASCRQGEFQCKSSRKCISNSNVCNNKPDCQDGSDEANCQRSQTCGVQEIKPEFISQGCPPFNPLTKIVGGCAAIPNSWPWTLQLRNNQSLGGTVHRCGAVLISPSVALTAKHCFQWTPEPSWWQAVAGRHTRDTTGNTDQIRKISRIIHLPKNPGKNDIDGDITVIKFDRPFTINKYVTTICLPTREPNTKDDCAVAGWGDTKGTGNEDVLKQSRMPIVDRDTCNKTKGITGGKITQNMVCGGWKKGKHDACQADSGGPLMCTIGGKYYLEGIVSWGDRCGEPDIPGVYVNVFNVINWIKQQMS